MNIEIFQTAGNEINLALNSVSNSMQSGWLSGLITAAKFGLILYFTVYGYMILAGKKQSPFKDIMWDIGRFSVILVFLSAEYLSYINPIVDNIKDFLSGETSTYNLIDKRIESFITLLVDLWEKNDWYVAICLVFLCIPMVLGITALGAVLLFTEITLKILIAAAPIFIFCLMWGFLKGSFSRWVEAILGNCFIILFVSIFSKIGFKLIEYATTNSFSGVWTMPMLILIAGVMTMFSVKFGRDMALELASVSVDRAIGSSAPNIKTRDIAGKAINESKKAYNWFKNRKDKGDK